MMACMCDAIILVGERGEGFHQNDMKVFKNTES